MIKFRISVKLTKLIILVELLELTNIIILISLSTAFEKRRKRCTARLQGCRLQAAVCKAAGCKAAGSRLCTARLQAAGCALQGCRQQVARQKRRTWLLAVAKISNYTSCTVAFAKRRKRCTVAIWYPCISTPPRRQRLQQAKPRMLSTMQWSKRDHMQ